MEENALNNARKAACACGHLTARVESLESKVENLESKLENVETVLVGLHWRRSGTFVSWLGSLLGTHRNGPGSTISTD